MRGLRKMIRPRNERGVTLVLVAITAVAMGGMAALAIDVSMLYDARTEAQRAADAAALAGASAFISNPVATDPATIAQADSRARALAQQNTIRNTAVLNAETQVDVTPALEKVGVTITRANVPTFFARLLGVNAVTIAAHAAAHAITANSASCVKPITIPDLWNEKNNEGATTKEGVWNVHQDPAGGFDAPGEEWYRDPGETYDPATTGYGTSARNGVVDKLSGKTYTNDVGRPVVLAIFDPKQGNVSSFYQSWGLGGNGGASDMAAAILNNCPLTASVGDAAVGATVSAGNGAKLGPLTNAWDQLIAQDANATWDPVNNKVVPSTNYPDPLSSPRVIRVPLFVPITNMAPNSNSLTFTNVALFFLEPRVQGKGGNKAPVVGRFMSFANGFNQGGGAGGGNVKTLQLIE